MDLRFFLHHLDLFAFLFFCTMVPVATAGAWLRKWRGRRDRTWLRWTWTALLFVELLCVLYANRIEPRWLEVSRHRVSLPGLRAPLCIVHLSDLHLQSDPAWQAEVLARVRMEKPDLILLTGDYLNEPKKPEQLLTFCRALVDMVGPERIFAVGGNFELVFKTEGLLHEAGVATLDGVMVFVTCDGAAVQIGGIGYRLCQSESERELQALAEQVVPDLPAILLHHTPDLAESEGIERFDLILSGHTHGGQVRLPFYGALITLARHGKRYEAGWYGLTGGGRLFVSRGVGTEAPPAPRLRFLCRPEVVVMDLLPGDDAR